MDDPRLTFHGAAHCVTGSCHRLETPGGTVLIDCGMFQGSKTEKALNYRDFPFDPARIDAVILTHAHIDHSGLLPKLVKDGFRGRIHATPATTDLCGVMLPDSAHIQEYEVGSLNRRNARRSRDPVQPIYTVADAETCLKQFRAEPFGRWFTPLPGLRVRFWNAGHLLGSASVEIEVDRADRAPLRLLFSGDIGPDEKLLQPDPQGPRGIDYLICEATYGDTDRTDASAEDRRTRLRAEVLAAMNPRGALLIPSFAVERAQELISDLALLMARGDLPPIPVHIDSPLARAATAVFARHAGELQGGATLTQGLGSPQVSFTETVEDSIALDHLTGFHIVIAASGMCDAGRIRHRLKNWIWRPEATLLLVGFQAAGTLGRILQEGAASVRIQGEEFAVRARIRSIDLYSGHADAPELVAWVKARLPLTGTLFLTHGEPPALAGLADRLAGLVAPDRRVTPPLDATYALTPKGAVPLADRAPPRLAPAEVARMDWHNDLSRLILDLNRTLANTPDAAARDRLIADLAARLHPDAPRRRRHPDPRRRRT